MGKKLLPILQQFSMPAQSATVWKKRAKYLSWCQDRKNRGNAGKGSSGRAVNRRGAAVAAGKGKGGHGQGKGSGLQLQVPLGISLVDCTVVCKKINCDCYTLTFFLLLYSTCSPTCFSTDTQILSCFVWTHQWRGFSWHKGLINNIEPLLTAVFASRVSC